MFWLITCFMPRLLDNGRNLLPTQFFMLNTPVGRRRALSEFLCAFLLTAAVATSIAANNPVPTPLVAGLTLMVLAYLFGPISGAHANPAVTIGLFGIKKMKFMEAITYIIAQLLGGFVAALLVVRLVTMPELLIGATTPGMIGEMLGALVLAFGVTMVVKGRVDSAASGLAVGLSLLLGVGVAVSGSLGVINPAVALGLGLFDPGHGADLIMKATIYILAPIIGGFLGSQLAHWFAPKG